MAHKPDSQEICFVPDNDYASFIDREAGEKVPGPGNFVTEDKGILDAAREAEAVRITEGYANAIAQLGFDREKTEALLEKYLRKDEANGNNT